MPAAGAAGLNIHARSRVGSAQGRDVHLVSGAGNPRTEPTSTVRVTVALPYEKAKSWYGTSADTAERGLLTVSQTSKPAPLTAAGYTVENRYALQPPFFSSRKPPRLAAVRPIRSAS